MAVGWCDYHLWEFTIAKRRYGLPVDEDWGTEPRIDASKVRLRDVLSPRKTTIDYLYDFGDCWEHRLTVTNVRAGDPNLSYPRYIAGERNGPPEDCGGIPGFYRPGGSHTFGSSHQPAYDKCRVCPHRHRRASTTPASRLRKKWPWGGPGRREPSLVRPG